MAVKYVCLEHVSLAELAQQGLYPVGQIRFQDKFWVALDVGMEEAQLLTKLTSLGFTPQWTDAGDLQLLVNNRKLPEQELRPMEPQYKAVVRSWLGATAQGYREKLLALLDQILLPAVKRSVNLWVPHNTNRDPIYGPEFNVFVWASPTPLDEPWVGPERAYGVSNRARADHRFGKWAEGTPIVTPEGDEIGAIDGNNLFIYVDLVHFGDEQELRQWKALLGEAVKVLATTDETFDPVAAKGLYVELCGRRLVQQLRFAETSITVTRGEIDETNKQLLGKLRQLEKFQREAAAMAAAASTGLSKFEQEFDSLCKIPKISSVAFRGNMLVISTHILRAVNPATERTHEIGKFKFITDTERGTVKILNQTRLIDGFRPKMQAPHVFPDGRPCLGSLEATIPQLVGSYEFSALAQILIAYIESVNLDDGAGRYIERWPMVVDGGGLRTPDNGKYEIKITSIEEMRDQTKAALAAFQGRAAAEAVAEVAAAAAAPAPARAQAMEQAPEEAVAATAALGEIVTDINLWREEAT